MKKLTAVFVFFVIAVSTFAQDIKLPNIDAIHVFSGLNIPTQDVSKEQFRFDYMRLHVDLSNDVIKMQFRHDFASNKLQLANVTKSFGNFTVMAGRFLDPVWWLFPAPHTMSQTSYASSVNSFTVLDDGISVQYDDILDNKRITARVAIFDCNESREISGSIDVAFSEETHFGYFFQTRGSNTGFGLMARTSLYSLLNVEGGVVSRPTLESLPEFYVQNQAKVTEKLSVWLQGDFRIDSGTSGATTTVRTMIGAAYKYSQNSHLKLFYNFIDKVAVCKISFFL